MNRPTEMDYQDFKAQYIEYFKEMNKYTPDQVGSQLFCEKLAKLEDDHPDFALALEIEAFGEKLV